MLELQERSAGLRELESLGDAAGNGLEGFGATGLRRAVGQGCSSTPSVVPGAAPALAKAGVGGFFIDVLLWVRKSPHD